MVASIQFQELCAVPALEGFSLVRTDVANDGSLLFLFAEASAASSLSETYASGIGVFPRSRSSMASRLCLVRILSGVSQTIALPELDLTFPKVDVFPDGRILVAGPRSSWRSRDDFDLNGAILEPETGQVTRILLGDGISSMQVDGLGRIWVGYSDEGVYGNYGWGDADGPLPIGCSGLVCFSDTGQPLWQFPQGQAYSIDDCYALNVSGSEAAIFFYSDFPICRIGNGFELTFFRTDLGGCHSFAVSETQALFSGQYKEPPDTAYLGEFMPGRFTNVRKLRLLLPDGSPRSGGELLARGKCLYHVDAEKVCRLSLD